MSVSEPKDLDMVPLRAVLRLLQCTIQYLHEQFRCCANVVYDLVRASVTVFVFCLSLSLSVHHEALQIKSNRCRTAKQIRPRDNAVYSPKRMSWDLSVFIFICRSRMMQDVCMHSGVITETVGLKFGITESGRVESKRVKDSQRYSQAILIRSDQAIKLQSQTLQPTLRHAG